MAAQNFDTATEAYRYIMAKVAEANEAGDTRKARAWAAKVTPALRRAYEGENTYRIAE